MIRLESVCKKYEEFKMYNVDLEIHKEEYFVILGPSGAGKTVLLEMIAGLIQPDSGFISGIKGARIGLIYQDYMLFPHLNVFQNISYGMKIKKEKPEKIQEMVASVSRGLSIDHLLNRDVKKLSGGEKQRVALARALVMEPDVVLLDEPTAALDLSTRIQVQRLLMQLHKRYHSTVIHVTHDFEEALALGDRITLLFAGKIIQTDKPEKVFKDPASKAAAAFLGYKNVFSGKIEHKNLRINGLNVTTSVDEAEVAYIAIRSNDIILSKEEIFSSARNSFPGKIVKFVNRTNHVEVLVDIGMLLYVDITYQSLHEMQLVVGSPVWTTFKTSAVKVFEH